MLLIPNERDEPIIIWSDMYTKNVDSYLSQSKILREDSYDNSC